MIWEDATWLNILVTQLALGAVPLFFAELSRICVCGWVPFAWCAVRFGALWESIWPQYILFDTHSWVAGTWCRPLKRMLKETETIYSSDHWERGTHWGGLEQAFTCGRERGAHWAPRSRKHSCHWPLMGPMAKCISNLWNLILGCFANRRVGWLGRSLICWGMGFPGGASGKEPACQCRRRKRHRFDSWVGKIPWRRIWQPIPVFLPGKSHR